MAQSALYGILEEIRDQVQSLNLSGISAGNVVICASPANEIISMPSARFPAVVIGPYGAESIVAASNVRDDVSYPVVLAICDSLKLDAEQPGDKQREGFDKRLYWRETLRKAFSNQRLTQSTGFTMQLQPLPIVEPRAFERDLWVSSMLLRVTNREGRT